MLVGEGLSASTGYSAVERALTSDDRYPVFQKSPSLVSLRLILFQPRTLFFPSQPTGNAAAENTINVSACSDGSDCGCSDSLAHNRPAFQGYNKA